MSGLPRNVLGGVGTVMLIHAGYSAFESLSYEKSLNPSANLSIPLDVCIRKVHCADVVIDQTRDRGGGSVSLFGCRAQQCETKACEMECMDEYSRK